MKDVKLKRLVLFANIPQIGLFWQTFYLDCQNFKHAFIAFILKYSSNIYR